MLTHTSLQGDTDLMVPFTTVKAAANKVDWGTFFNTKDRDRFRKCLAENEYTYNDISLPSDPLRYANYVRAGGLNYVRVFGAGHMINEAKAPEAKHLFETWVFHPEKFKECTPPG